ncbi:hypothetical protein H6F89_34265 [Cyanobacteria bacterium FACHB-63]|nr:hypothetical protein [Cyanobacteria bacterium FACHB-63]
MLEIKYGANLTIPGGLQFSISNQVLRCEVYKHFSVTLDTTQDKKDVTLSKVKEFNLLVVKSTSNLAADSPSKLQYKIGDAESFVELDAPLLILETWMNAIAPDDLKIFLKLEPELDKNAAKFAKDSVKVEIVTGWADAAKSG